MKSELLHLEKYLEQVTYLPVSVEPALHSERGVGRVVFCGTVVHFPHFFPDDMSCHQSQIRTDSSVYIEPDDHVYFLTLRELEEIFKVPQVRMSLSLYAQGWRYSHSFPDDEGNLGEFWIPLEEYVSGCGCAPIFHVPNHEMVKAERSLREHKVPRPRVERTECSYVRISKDALEGL